MAFHARESVSSLFDLAAFIDRNGDTLPKVVKIVDGFCGANDDDSLDPDQILVFYRLEEAKIILAMDEFRQQICIQENSNAKVYLLPPECSALNTVQELTTVQSLFILVLEDILSAGIVSGSKLKLLRDERSVPNHLKCKIVGQDEFGDVLLPLHLKGKFLPLLDPSEYYLHEVLEHNQLPVNVRFICDSSKLNDRFIAQSLVHLGNLLLTHKTGVTMVFAASFDHELSLYVFPRTLDITVSLGFDDSKENSDKVKECKRLLQESEPLDHVVKGSFYFMARPVRRFHVQPPKRTYPVPLPRSRSKAGATKRDNAPPGSVKPLPRRRRLRTNSEDAQEYEAGPLVEPNTDSKGQDDVFEYSASSGISHEFNSEVPVLPPKTIWYPGGGNETKTSKLYNPSSPVPTSRKQLMAIVEYAEVSKDCELVEALWREGSDNEYIESAQRTENPEPEDRIEETCPELPPKPIFLQPFPADNEENESLMPQDSPPPLPQRKGQDSCPGELFEKEGNTTFIGHKNPSPALPPRNELSDVAYTAVNVLDWKWYEDRIAYTEVKDDEAVFSQGCGRSLSPEKNICGFGTEECLVEKEKKRDGESSCEISERLRAEKIVAGQGDEGDEPYEEMDHWCACSSTEKFQSKMNTNPRKKELIEVSKNPSTTNIKGQNVHSSTQTSQEKPVIASSRRLKKELMISKRREDNFMDLKDIERYLKLRKELSDMRDQVKELEKKVSVKEGPMDGSHVLSYTSDGMTSSHRFDSVGDSQYNENKSTDENKNIFISIKTLKICKGSSESGNVGLVQVGKNTEKEIPSSISPVNVLKSDDEDEVYAECCEREYSHLDNNSAYYRINSEQGGQITGDNAKHETEPVYYNTVEVGTSSYLQLDNSSEEDVNVYVNVDAEDAEWGTLKELPPLPPKTRKGQAVE